jgi:uncharacterized membrane protein
VHGAARSPRHAPRSGTWSLATCLSIAALVAVAAPVGAHKRHQAAGAEALSTAGRDSALNAAAGDSAPSPAEPLARAPFVMPAMGDEMLHHPHNKVVHFPLALALAAALLLLVARRRPELEPAGRWLVWLAALGGVAAYFSGRLQEEAFEGEPKAWLVDLHEKWGLATAIVLVAWALLTLWGPGRKHAWLWGLVAAALVLITGFYGGVVAHGE